MIHVIINSNTHIIREVLESSDEAFACSLLQNNEYCQEYQEFQGYTGLDIRRLDNTGMFLSLEEQMNNTLIPLDELYTLEQNYYLDMQHHFDHNLPYTKEKKLLNLIQQGITALNSTPKLPNEPQEPIIEEAPELPQDNSPAEELPTEDPTDDPSNNISDTLDLEPKEKTIADIIHNKEREIYTLKDQYLDADIDGSQELKLELKQQIQALRTEIAHLSSLS